MNIDYDPLLIKLLNLTEIDREWFEHLVREDFTCGCKLEKHSETYCRIWQMQNFGEAFADTIVV